MDWLIERFQSSQENIAFIHEGREVTYGEVLVTIAAFRTRIDSAGIQKGDAVVVVGDYSPEVFCLMLALAQNASIVIPLTKNSIIEESVALGVSGCDWYVEFTADGVHATITSRLIVSDNVLLASFRARSSPGLVLFSSGSTGKPKGILHDFNLVMEKFRKQRQAVVAIPFLMIDHFGGINTILAITSSLGTVVTVSDRTLAKICRAIESYKVELLPATPSFLTLLMASSLHSDFDLSSLKRITYGTEVMPLSTLNRLLKTFPGVNLQQTYGLSEVGVLRSQSRNDGSLWVRIGGEGFQTKIVNDVLWIKSKYAMVGYLNAPSEFDADGWFNTQDQVEVDGEFYRILGRVTDLINVGGQKVSPAEVESVILEMDNVRDVSVFGEKHALIGQVVVARVSLKKSESAEAIKKRIRQYCLGRLSSYKIPVKVTVTDTILYNVRQKKIRHIIS
jgi:acyl-CoA synthetase (AMP-forming)/AMP-acid ligase II